MYLWTRTTTTYKKSPTTVAYSVSYWAEDGADGEPGADGANGKDAAEVQQNLLSDANFQEGIAQNIAIGEGWRIIGGEKVTGIDGKTAIYLDNTEGETNVDLLNQMLFKYGATQKIEPGEYYTLSFWAKGTQVDTFLYGATGYQVVNTNNAVYIDGEPVAAQPADGWYAWVLDENTWVRHTYTFQTKSTVISDEYDKKLLFRVQAGQKAYICMPKLERGLRGTAFGISPNDLTERATTFMGEFDPSKTYTGTGSIRQIVKYNNGYFMTMRTAGNFQGSSIYPSGNGLKWYWKEFDASFENIATGLLFAEEAVIENAVVRKLRTNDGIEKRILITGNEMQVFDDSNKLKLRVSGETITGAGTASTQAVPTESESGEASASTTILVCDKTWELWSFSVTATNNIVTIPEINAKIDAIIQHNTGEATFKTRAELLIDGIPIQHLTREGSQGSNLVNLFSYFTFPKMTQSMSMGNHTVSVRIYMLLYNANWSGHDFKTYTAKVEPKVSGAVFKLDYTDEILEIGENGIKGVFGSAMNVFQCTKENGVLKLQLRSGNYGISVDNTGVKLILGGTAYTLSRDSGGQIIAT